MPDRRRIDRPAALGASTIATEEMKKTMPMTIIRPLVASIRLWLVTRLLSISRTICPVIAGAPAIGGHLTGRIDDVGQLVVGDDAAVLPGGGDQGGRNGAGDRAHEVHEAGGRRRLLFVDRAHGESRQGDVVHRHADAHEEQRDADHPVAHVGGGYARQNVSRPSHRQPMKIRHARIDSVGELGRDRREDDRQQRRPRRPRVPPRWWCSPCCTGARAA